MMCMWAFLGLGLETVAHAQLSVPPYATVQGSPYRVNPGDELEIHVWGDERLQRQRDPSARVLRLDLVAARLQRNVLVLPDGTFDFPLVGQVNAAGRLPGEIERVITVGLQPQYKGPVPQVTVSVKKASGYQFSVIGKVRSPGTFTPGRYVNALEALAISGGPAEFANLGNARLIRKVGDRMIVMPLRLQAALRGDLSALTPSAIPRLETGDTLVVP